MIVTCPSCHRSLGVPGRLGTLDAVCGTCGVRYAWVEGALASRPLVDAGGPAGVREIRILTTTGARTVALPRPVDPSQLPRTAGERVGLLFTAPRGRPAVLVEVSGLDSGRRVVLRDPAKEARDASRTAAWALSALGFVLLWGPVGLWTALAVSIAGLAFLRRVLPAAHLEDRRQALRTPMDQTAGRYTRKVVPRPGEESTVMPPP